MQRVDIEPAIAYLRRRLATLRAVYLFGSQSRGEGGAESDIDIAFLADDSPSATERHAMSSELSELLGRDVDLVDLTIASTVIRAQVIGKGTRVAGAATPALEEFESRVFSDYARLNEERATILRDIHQRGAVHGG